AFARLSGRDPQRAIGRDLRDLVPEIDRPRILPLLAEIFAGRPTAPLDFEFVDAGGRKVRTAWNLAGVRSGRRGVGEGLVAVGQDMTRIHSLERQVIQAEKLATLGQLAAGVVHELGNPLTAITVYADHLVKKLERVGLDGGDGEKLRRILEGAERILNFS